jgi:hypothetical protein
MNTELKQKIKNLIEELNYRTDQKSAEELKKLSAELYETAIELVFIEKMPKVEAPQAEPPKQKAAATQAAAEAKKPVVDLFAHAEMEPETEPVEIVQVIETESVELEKGAITVTTERETTTTRVGKTLNDSFHAGISIGFNDRFAFVHKLFDGSEDEYYRVLSQLNTMTNLKEAVAFLENVVKPDYNWADKEEFETRLKEILEHHFS